MVGRRVMGVGEKEHSVPAFRDCRMNDTGQWLTIVPEPEPMCVDARYFAAKLPGRGGNQSNFLPAILGAHRDRWTGRSRSSTSVLAFDSPAAEATAQHGR